MLDICYNRFVDTISWKDYITDVVTTARLLRHKDTSLVMRYAHQDTEDLRKAHRQLSPADSLK